MIKRIGKSDLELSEVALGAWAIGGWMWGGTDRRESVKAIHACQDHGITTIDTAPVYGFGLSEQIVGQAVGEKRDRYQVLTKAGMRWDVSKGQHYFTTKDNEGKLKDVYKYSGRESVLKECEESLRRLGTDYIDLYQIHWPDPTTPVEETMEAFEILLAQGKIRAAGVSNFSLDQLKQASARVSIGSNQVPYSMVRREIEDDLVPWCIKNQCAILAYSPLQRGLLTGKITPEHPFAPGDSRPETPHFRINNLIRINQFLEKIKPIAEERKVSLSQLVIRWTLQQPGITVALVGARNEAQVAENAGALRFTLSEEEVERINGHLNRVKLELH